jgi:HSP20 family protein
MCQIDTPECVKIKHFGRFVFLFLEEKLRFLTLARSELNGEAGENLNNLKQPSKKKGETNMELLQLLNPRITTPTFSWPTMEDAFSGLLDGEKSSYPSVHVHEDKDNYYLEFDLPGVQKEDLSVKTENQTLNVEAKRRFGTNGNARSYSIRRSWNLPDDVNSEKIDAAYTNGVLTFTLPKKEEAKPKQIDIKVK